MGQQYQNDEWRELFGTRFEDFTAPPPPQGWRKVRPVWWYRWLWGALLLLLVAGAVGYLGGTKQEAEAELATPTPAMYEQQPSAEQKIQTVAKTDTEIATHKTPDKTLAPSPDTREAIGDKIQYGSSQKMENTDKPHPSEWQPIPVSLLKPLAYRPLGHQPDAPELQKRTAATGAADTENTASRSAVWRIFVQSDLVFWHLRANPRRPGQRTAFPEKSVPRLRDRLSYGLGVERAWQMGKKGHYFLRGQYRFMQEDIDYHTLEASVADFVASRDAAFSAFPNYKERVHHHRRNLHLFSAGLGLSYPVYRRQEVGGALLATVASDGSTTRTLLGSEVFFRRSWATGQQYLELSPVFTYFWQRTTPQTAGFRGQPYSFGVRLGMRF